jgi:hypothetical protein
MAKITVDGEFSWSKTVQNDVSREIFCTAETTDGYFAVGYTN